MSKLINPSNPNGGAQGVDINKGTLVKCEKCGNSTFQEVSLLFHFSALVSPTGKDIVVPLPVASCNACGHINDDLLPPAVKKTQAPPTPKITL